MTYVECNMHIGTFTHSYPGEKKTWAAGVDTWIEEMQTMSDCLNRWTDNLPGCPEPLSGMLKRLYDRRSAINQARLHSGPQPLLLTVAGPEKHVTACQTVQSESKSLLLFIIVAYWMLKMCEVHTGHNKHIESMHVLLGKVSACTHAAIECDLMLCRSE
jgi:hypothetical protein